MVLFTKEIEGVEVVETDEPVVFEVNDGRPSKAYKKPWKTAKLPNRTHEVRVTQLSREEKEKRRHEHTELKGLMHEAKAQREKRSEQRKQARALKEKRIEESHVKGLQQGQIIKDIWKTRKWSKRARAKLMKMPKEMFEKYLKTPKQN